MERTTRHLLGLAAIFGLALGPWTERAVGRDDAKAQTSDALLRLVPADAAIVLTVDNLRDGAQAFLKSRLADDLRELPAVRAWFGSEKYEQFERSRTHIETLFGTSLAELRDNLLGDAVVFALRLTTDAKAGATDARGLLLVKARDSALLARVIDVINATQRDNGELAAVLDRTRGGVTYHTREFPAEANRPTEWYVTYPDGTFGFSNSESLIHSVIDRKGAERDRAKPGIPPVEPGLGDLPNVGAVAAKLPNSAVARVLVDPRPVERLLAAQPRSSKPAEARIFALLERYLAAVEYAGVALTWNEGSVVLHGVDTLNPSRVDPWLRRWAGDERPSKSLIARVPATALAVAAGNVDGPALFEAFTAVVADSDPVKAANLEELMTGLMLGQDVRKKVVPRLGPGAIAYLDAPAELGGTGRGGSLFPLVAAIELADGVRGDESVPLTTAIDNALRTFLAMIALDDKRAKEHAQVTPRTTAPLAVTSLDRATPFAYAVDRTEHCLVLGTSADAVARYLQRTPGAGAEDLLHQIATAARAPLSTFAYLDLDTINKLAVKQRPALLQLLAARPERTPDQVERDLTHVLALARLFRAAFITSQIEADATVVRRSVGFIRHAGPGH
jgi:hypothetical protein